MAMKPRKKNGVKKMRGGGMVKKDACAAECVKKMRGGGMVKKDAFKGGAVSKEEVSNDNFLAAKTFELDVTDYIEEAFERCGLEVRTGYDIKTAKRSLNLMLI